METVFSLSLGACYISDYMMRNWFVRSHLTVERKCTNFCECILLAYPQLRLACIMQSNVEDYEHYVCVCGILWTID